MKTPIYIGVDPSFRKNGFWACLVDMRTKTREFLLFDTVLDWYDWLREKAPEFAFVAIENSNKQNKSFDTTGRPDVVARKGRNVGTNQAASELAVIAAIRRYGPGRVFSISPKEKGRKWTPEQFVYISQADGLPMPKGGSNQDQRDAYKMATIARRYAMLNGKFKMA